MADAVALGDRPPGQFDAPGPAQLAADDEEGRVQPSLGQQVEHPSVMPGVGPLSNVSETFRPAAAPVMAAPTLQCSSPFTERSGEPGARMAGRGCLPERHTTGLP